MEAHKGRCSKKCCRKNTKGESCSTPMIDGDESYETIQCSYMPFIKIYLGLFDLVLFWKCGIFVRAMINESVEC